MRAVLTMSAMMALVFAFTAWALVAYGGVRCYSTRVGNTVVTQCY